MAYQSLYRRYRPRRFAEVRGQEHLVRALRNAVAEDRVGHAYLFSGPRGTGKTSTARILAKVLNCENPIDGEPCCECQSCLSIEAGTSFDLHELDAASNRGIDEMRSLLDSAALGTPGRTKVYILDEVHMLTPQASAALLKTLEEPPAHVVFVLATTDPQKVLPTIRSRTQHFELGLLPADELADHVRYVAGDAGLEVSGEQVEYVVRKGAGSARDTLSALDQVVAAGGVPDEHEALDAIVDALVEQDAAGVLRGVHEQLVAGREPRVVGEALLVVLRNAFLSSMDADLGNLSDADQAAAADHARRLGARTITRALEVLGEALVDMRQAADPRIALEVALIRLARPDADGSLAALADRVDQLERAVRGAGSVAPEPVRAGREVAGPGAGGADAPGGGDAAGPAGPAGAVPRERGEESAVAQAEPTDGGSEPARGRPADGARQALARTASSAPEQSRERRSGGTQRPTSEDDPRPGGSKLAAHRGQESNRAKEPRAGTEPPATSEAQGPATGDGSVAILTDRAAPGRDDLTLAWGDSILDGLSQAARTRYRDGRFLDVDGEEVVFALPSPIHVERAEKCRAEVEDALADSFGLRLRLRLVDSPSGHASDEPPAEIDGAEVDPVEDIGPVDELADAHDVEQTHLQRITEAFPGAELLDEGEGATT